MQNIIFYVAADSALGQFRDSLGAKKTEPPTLVKGAEYCFRMRLFANLDGFDPYPMDQFSQIVSWRWVMDDDFDSSSNLILVGDNQNIIAESVTDEIDGTERSYTQVSIPITDTNTVELNEYLGTAESKNTLNGELAGYNAGGDLIFILQVKGFVVRNRISGSSDPTAIPSDYLTAAQVRSLIAAGISVRYSVDGSTDWHDNQTDADRYISVRSASDVSAAWSDAIALLVGPTGAKGDDTYCYTAYASDAAGTGFSLTPTNALKYRAEIHVSEAIAEPSATDFSYAVWVKYLGDDGTGVGDMLKSAYDTDDDGIVDNAEHSGEADVVPWAGVSGKPDTFTPSTHTHAMAEIPDPVRQKVASESNPATLYLNSPVLLNSSVQSGATLAIDFTAIKTKAVGGAAYTGSSGDFFTWEYHVTCSVDITAITVGSLNSTMVGIAIPETLERVNNANTTHVFVVRGIYKSGAVNGLKLQVNYAYSYEA